MSKYVVVRSGQSGVWCGRLAWRKGSTVALIDARRAWSWAGALSCSELAVHGPGVGSRICGAVSGESVIMGCCEILPATAAAARVWAAAPAAVSA